jgi:catechol 2,3-dioxygenase-like lactoylglutathione lyase family enzyme
MEKIALNLVVLRSGDIEQAAEFYSHLGLHFTRHRHARGPEHFAAEVAGAVFELYPLAAESPGTLGTRVGFKVPSVDRAVAAVSHYPNAVLLKGQSSPWGRRAVIIDPDGHRVELTEG